MKITISVLTVIVVTLLILYSCVESDDNSRAIDTNFTDAHLIIGNVKKKSQSTRPVNDVNKFKKFINNLNSEKVTSKNIQLHKDWVLILKYKNSTVRYLQASKSKSDETYLFNNNTLWSFDMDELKAFLK
ncbi:MAG: hypothetical protein COA79_19290 [Planctomycetota bacterium]|nr:MAG: hypothetical protein COA79_19290 [Planctomycetota bacterium]